MVTLTVGTTATRASNLSLQQFVKVMLHLFPEGEQLNQKSESATLRLPMAARATLVDNLDLVANLDLRFE
jgi:hypothetical protein